MNTRLLLAAVLVLCMSNLQGNAEEPVTYQFGKDELVFGGKPGAEQSARLADHGGQAIEMADLPVRKGVAFYRVPRVGLVAEMEKNRVPVSWENVGDYLGEIHSKEKMTALLTVLHDDFQKTRIGLGGYSKILLHLTPAKAEWPFVVSHTQLDESTIKTGCFERDGLWLAHFLCVEGASVVEYKYAVSKKNGVARIRRVVVEGPENPTAAGEPLPPSEWPPEKQEQLTTFRRCRDYLISQTMCNEGTGKGHQ